MTEHRENQENGPQNPLESLIKATKNLSENTEADNEGGAPVHLWNPEFCGALDMVIKSDGSWHYNKSPIGRKELVKLFASVIKREGDDFFLVTPVEKIAITVEDAPFIATEMHQQGNGKNQILSFTTNVGNRVTASKTHPLRFDPQPNSENLLPYIHIRHSLENALEAKLSRSVYYELANLSEPLSISGETFLGVWSAGEFFPIEKLENCN